MKVERSDEGWRITNLNFGYTWEACRVDIGASSTKLAPLPPDLKPVLLKRSELTPALAAPDAERIWVSCKAGGITFIATAEAK